VATLLSAAEYAAASPGAGRRVPELGRDDIREVLKGKYRIVYRVTAERVEVLTVFEGHRLFPDDVPPGR
jgi:toxin ParE1/3/4